MRDFDVRAIPLRKDQSCHTTGRVLPLWESFNSIKERSQPRIADAIAQEDEEGFQFH